jgi:hypothetical protein
MATIEWSADMTSSVPKLQDATLGGILLDDLHALSRLLKSPIGLLGVRVELAKRREACLRRLQDLADQILFQSEMKRA